MPNEDFLTPAEFAKLLSWHPSVSTVWRWAKDGKIAALDVSLNPGRAIYKIHRSQVAVVEERFRSHAENTARLTTK